MACYNGVWEFYNTVNLGVTYSKSLEYQLFEPTFFYNLLPIKESWEVKFTVHIF